MSEPQVVQELKRDVFGRVERLEGEAGAMARRVACGSRVPGSGLVARILMRRERRALARLAGIGGVPRPIEGSGESRDVLLRSWVEGVPLYAASALPEDFFERLEDLVHALHDRGVCHNDLHKEPNVIVQPDGYPGLIDFQLASVHASRGRRFRSRMEEDLRHVAKHRRVYAQGTGRGAAQATAAEPGRSFLAATWMRLGKPAYNLVTKRWLGRGRGEPRRPREGPWPTWTPPVGPR